MKDLSQILKRPRVTEKGTLVALDNAYVFDVSAESTKHDIEKAVFELYKVKPVKVNVLKVPSKNVIVRGKRGVKKGGRKAYVYLKAGDKIEIA